MKYIPFSQTGFFSNIILDYIRDKPELRPFYGYRPDAESILKYASERKFDPERRKNLVKVLNEQYSGLKVTGQVRRNIDALLQENTFTVTTGHQLNLFTGPLYYIYKIAQTIKLAQKLSAADGTRHFVPVYWMASEDHDQAEINHAHILGSKIQWPVSGNDASGRISTERVLDAVSELKELCEKFNFPKERTDWMIEAYTSSKNLAEATRRVVDHLFAEEGILVLDADHDLLKSSFRSIMKDELEHETSSALVKESIEAMPDTYKVQVNPRAINLFYLNNNSRDRIIRSEEGQFFAGDNLIADNLDALLQILEADPRRFSPNVVLRPLYQEHILPNLAYVGGGGELAYWFEYKKMFEHYGLDFPVLVLRNSILIIDHGSGKKLEKLGITHDHLFQDVDLLIREFVKEEDGDKLNLNDELKQIDNIFSSLALKARDIDPTLEPAFEAEKQKQFKLMHQLEDKLVRASKKKHETEVNQIRGLKEKLFPGNSLQERHDNFLNFYLKYPEWLSELKDQIDPLKMEFGIMELN